MDKVITAKDLRKFYQVEKPLFSSLIKPFQKTQRVRALDSVSFSVQNGQILGIVGPNGAGKTTLLKILAGLLWQDEGEIKLLGLTYRRSGRELRGHIGYVSSDERSFFWRLSGRDNLEFFGRLNGLTSKSVRFRVGQVLDEFQFSSYADRLFGDYSAGMRKKVAVMRSLLHEPAILLLDEATNSLDPASAEHVKSIIRDYVSQKDNRAAIWSTHRLEEIPHICNQVIAIEKGKIVSDDPISHDSVVQEYVLRTQPLNGEFGALCSMFQNKIHQTKICDGLNEFVFRNIDSDEFSKIVTAAVMDYGASILFAGCLNRMEAEG